MADAYLATRESQYLVFSLDTYDLNEMPRLYSVTITNYQNLTLTLPSYLHYPIHQISFHHLSTFPLTPLHFSCHQSNPHTSIPNPLVLRQKDLHGQRSICPKSPLSDNHPLITQSIDFQSHSRCEVQQKKPPSTWPVR